MGLSTLATRERVLGPDHPDTATSLNDLGTLLWTRGELTTARFFYEGALAIRERVLGPDYPETAASLNNLALVLRRQGQLEVGYPHVDVDRQAVAALGAACRAWCRRP